MAEFVTPIINGKLAGVIVDANKNVKASISLDEFESVLIWKDVNFFGQKYLSLRSQPIHNDGLMLKNEHTKWSLNDRLRIRVKGPFNATVNFVVRWY